MKPMHAMQADTPDKGKLTIQINSEITSFPIADASISISYTGVPEQTLEQVTTDSSGQTETLELAAPPLEYSLNPTIESQPYSEYTLSVTAPGFEPINISGTEILPDVTAIQNITMRPSTATPQQEVFVIPAHTLYGTYPPKIAEDEIKPTDETGEIVLSRVVVPEFIVVHDGSPRDSTAQNYYVKYKDYIKNVASSEIYATWPENTIRANVLAIMSFTLNRVYTEWYRNKGYDFTITSSTAFDHKWIPERNIYDTISVIVDELFANYLSRPNVRQPILTQYCDGRQVSCPNWMTI
ncbi:carboxypeptidase regulatory-like domain-containing protein [Coprococcus sp. AF27-8]|nr:carboxypeptidase regulatory-like domain-containing protein [Coprococcus sp. AF27-8]